MNWQILADRLECHDISENRLLSIPGRESGLSWTYISAENLKLDSSQVGLEPFFGYWRTELEQTLPEVLNLGGLGRLISESIG